MSAPLATLHLNLAKNNVQREGGTAILQALAAHDTLETVVLNFSQNAISNPCVHQEEKDDASRSSKEPSPNRKTLSGTSPKEGKKGTLDLPKSLVTFSLNLESNNIEPFFAVLLGTAVGRCKKLKKLTLDLSNSISMRLSLV